MVGFDRAYVSVGLAWLIVGMIFGLYMGLTGSNQFVVVHVAMLLPGAVVLALYGLIYRAWPALNQSRLARLQFWFAVISVFGLVFGGQRVGQVGQVGGHGRNGQRSGQHRQRR